MAAFLAPAAMAVGKAVLPYLPLVIPSIVNLFQSSGGAGSKDEMMAAIGPAAKKMAAETGISEEEAHKALAEATIPAVERMGGGGMGAIESLMAIAGVAIGARAGVKAYRANNPAQIQAPIGGGKPIDPSTIQLGPSQNPRLTYDPNAGQVPQRRMAMNTQQQITPPSEGVIERNSLGARRNMPGQQQALEYNQPAQNPRLGLGPSSLGSKAYDEAKMVEDYMVNGMPPGDMMFQRELFNTDLRNKAGRNQLLNIQSRY